LIGFYPTTPHLPAYATRLYPIPIGPPLIAISEIPDIICNKLSKDEGLMS
jgi:hypothetical protein